MSRIGPFCEDCGAHPCECEIEEDPPFFPLVAAVEEGESSSFCVFFDAIPDHVYRLWDVPAGDVADLSGDLALEPVQPGRYQVLATLDRTTGEETVDMEPIRPDDAPGDAQERLFARRFGDERG